MDSRLAAIVVVSGFLLTGPLQAAIVVYDFSGSSGSQAQSPASVFDAHVVALDVTRGSGLSAPSGANSFNSASWHDLSASDYVSFGFSVAPGYQAELSSLSFTSRSSASGPGALAVRSSIDGFASNLLSWNQTGSGETAVLVDLSGLGQVSGLAEFRVVSLSNVSAGGGSVGSSGTWRIGTMTDVGTSNLLTVDGQVLAFSAVPEPASWALATLGMLGAAAAGARRRVGTRARRLAGKG